MNIEASLGHGKNLKAKRKSLHYKDTEHQALLDKLEKEYSIWKQRNLKLKGSTDDVVVQRVAWLNKYKDFADAARFATAFDSRSRLHSSILEEFLVYLFKDSVPSIEKHPALGGGKAYSNLHFEPSSFGQLLDNVVPIVESKDQDFLIGAHVTASFQTETTKPIAVQFNLPFIAIEAKTYVDKTMLGEISTSAEALKRAVPSSRYFVVAEYLKLSGDYQFGGSKVDQVYILRRQKNVDREFRLQDTFQRNPIHQDLVVELFHEVVDFLAMTPEGVVESRINRGKLL